MARVTEADVELMRGFEALSRLDLIELLVGAREARDKALADVEALEETNYELRAGLREQS